MRKSADFRSHSLTAERRCIITNQGLSNLEGMEQCRIGTKTRITMVVCRTRRSPNSSWLPACSTSSVPAILMRPLPAAGAKAGPTITWKMRSEAAAQRLARLAPTSRGFFTSPLSRMRGYGRKKVLAGRFLAPRAVSASTPSQPSLILRPILQDRILRRQQHGPPCQNGCRIPSTTRQRRLGYLVPIRRMTMKKHFSTSTTTTSASSSGLL